MNNGIYLSPLTVIWLVWALWPYIKNNPMFKKSTWGPNKELMKKYDWKPKEKWFK